MRQFPWGGVKRMLNRKEVVESIQERMQALKSAEICALFLLSVKVEDIKEEDKKADNEKSIKEVAGVLAHFFRQTDIKGYLGNGLYVVFLTGNVTGSTIYEKTAGLVQALRFASEDSWNGEAEVLAGVLLSSLKKGSYRYMFRKADYALEMARKDEKNHFYIYAEPDTQEELKQGLAAPSSSQMMFHYIDEGVRIIEAGDILRTVYVSPGFYRRLSLDNQQVKKALIQIHPDDIDDYETHVWETARSGEPGNSCYRVSLDGQNWISCRVRLLRIWAGNGERKPIIIEISHNTSGLERLKGQLDEKNAWLSFVADQTDYQLWEVDVRSRVFRMLYTDRLLTGRYDTYENFPESLIESGRIHGESAEAFRSFAGELLAGCMRNSGNFMIQYRQTSCYGWSAISYQMLCDEGGNPVKAIGIKEDLSYIPCQQSRFVQRRIMPADLYSNLYCFLQANLTVDTVEKLILEGRERIHLIQYQTYGEIIDKGISRLFSAEDVKRFRMKFSREQLLTDFERNRCWNYDRCRIVDFDGSIRWISLGVNLSRDPETRDVCLYAYLSRMDRMAEWEKNLKEEAQIDAETGLYTYDTLKNLIKNLLEQDGRQTYAVAQICIEGAEELFSNGPDDQREQDIATALHVFLNTDCLVGRKNKGNLLVFFPSCDTRSKIRRRLENAFSFVRISLSGMKEMKFLRLVAGVSVGKADECVLEDQLISVSGLCALHAGEAADMVEFCQETETYHWEGAPFEDQLNLSEPHHLELSHILTDEDKDMALECMEQMLAADNAKDSIKAVLRNIGLYYQADRVYILILTEKKQFMTMLSEWVRPGRYSIQQSVSGKRTGSFPIIANYAKHPESTVFTKRGEEEKYWQFAIFPMESEKDSEQMLCIENPRRYLERSALLDTLLPYLSREKKRFRETQVQNSPMDRFFALPNMEDCMNVLYSVNSDEYSSLGVMAVDVPEYEKVKKIRGFEYGRQLLLHISEVLQEVFDKSLLFHTKETEFLVLCTNVVYHTFLNLCARAKQMMGRQCKGLLRTGCTWSDGVFSARNLVEKACSIMECDNLEVRPETNKNSIDENNGFLEKTVMSKLETEGRMTIYLQPKINMRTGELMGAEALVRILDKNDKLLSHGRVIEEMEKEGTIQKLDYFVFDKMLDTMSQWKKMGYPMYPFSSNFSRYTLLNPSVLASALAIMSRYPHVPQEMIEIEITETAGDFENNTFEELIRRFGEHGLQFSLDDFGSGYSNVNMLAGLKFHSVKLDRSLIKNITENQMTHMIVRDLVKICDRCGMVCVAEGVENQTQADMLLEDGCICAQGFYYDRPMSLENFEKKYLRPKKKEVRG